MLSHPDLLARLESQRPFCYAASSCSSHQIDYSTIPKLILDRTAMLSLMNYVNSLTHTSARGSPLLNSKISVDTRPDPYKCSLENNFSARHSNGSEFDAWKQPADCYRESRRRASRRSHLLAASVTCPSSLLTTESVSRNPHQIHINTLR